MDNNDTNPNLKQLLKDIDWMIDNFINYPKIKIYEFEPTPPLSTYLYTINAGPYSIYHHKRKYNDSPP